MTKAGRHLALRPHSVAELGTKLRAFEPAIVEGVLVRLEELALLDDEAFAHSWVRERSRTKGPRALQAELRAKGVADEVIQAALGEAGDESHRADALAAGYLRRVAHKPPAKQAASIQAMLLRRGFSMDVAIGAARRVLPPEGWD